MAAKKLLYIANIRLPTEKAHGLQIMKTCEALAKQGVEIELIVPNRRSHIHDDPFSFYKVAKNFTVTRLWCLDLIPWKVLGKFGYWLESWTFYRSVLKYIKQQPAAIYYTRDLPIAYWLGQKVSPLFYEIHTLPDQATYYYRQAWQQARGLVVISQGLKQGLEQQGINPEKIVISPDAVDVEQFHQPMAQAAARAKLHLPLDKKIVVYTGHLYEWKGAHLVAEAAPLLSANVQVYIVGGTPGDVERFRNTYQHPQLTIVGFQPHETMPLWQQAADMLVVPTSAKTKIGSLYTSPLKLFEYMMADRPIVAADIPSLREVLDESTATFFTADNPASLAKSIDQVRHNPAVAAEQAKRARALVLKKYSWQARCEIIKQLILAD